MHKLNKPKQVKPMSLSHWYDTVGLISCTMLGLVSLCLVLPFVTNASSALDGSDYNKPAWIPSNYVSLSLGSMPAMDITPTGEGGSVGVSQASLKVSTTSNTGYKLYVSTLDHTTAMTSTDANQSAAIASTNTIATASNLAPNTWGYTITDAVSDSTTYSPMPTTSTIAYDTAQASGEHYLSFAAKIDTSLPAGQYSNTVAISAIANPAVITGMMELTYMQDMTSSICHDTVGYDQNYNRDSNGSYIITPGSEVTKQLIDSRDGKEYWVAKLADGHCWMTQNLALDLNSSKALTSSDTDLNSKSSWTSGFNTEKAVPVPVDYNAAQLNEARSYNLGQYVLAAPMRRIACDSAPANSSTIDDKVESLRPGQTLSQNCPDFVEVSGANWQPTHQISSGTWQTTQDIVKNASGDDVTVSMRGGTPFDYAGPVAVLRSANGGEYDAHYLIGNYYTYAAATAGSGIGLISGYAEDSLKDAPDSICPKNWQLPVTGRNPTNGDLYDRAKSPQRLFQAYGYPAASQYFKGVAPNYFSNTTILTREINNSHTTVYQDPMLSPIYFVYSGYLAPVKPYGTLRAAGNLNYERIATAFVDQDFSYDLHLSTGTIYPADRMGKSYGFGIRCLAR